MFALAPSKDHQTVLSYWARNRYKAHVECVRWTNRVFTDSVSEPIRSQIRLRPVLMTEDQKAAVIRLTGSSPFLEITHLPVARGRARSQTRKVGKK